MRTIFPFLLIPFLLIAGCAPAQEVPDVNTLSTQAVSTAYAELTQSALPTVTPTLPPISEAMLPAECLQLDERLNPNWYGLRENSAPWAKSVSCALFSLSQDNQHLAYVHYTFNDSPEVEARCKSVTKGTPEQCRASIGFFETAKVLDISTGKIHSLQSVALISTYLVFVKLEWLTTGELHYRLGNTEGPSYDLTYDPTTELVSAASPTPLPTPVSAFPVQVKEQIYAGEIVWAPDSQTLAVSSCYAGCRLELINPADLSQLWSVELNGMVTNLRFSPSGESVAVLLTSKTYEREIWLFNAHDGTIIQQIKLDDNDVRSFEFSPNGENIAVLVMREAGTPSEIWLLDSRDGKNLRQWTVEDAQKLHYSPSGEQIVTTIYQLALWNVSSGGRRWKLDPGAVTSQSDIPCEVYNFDQAMFSQDQSFLLARALGKNPDMEADCSYMLFINLKTGQFTSLQNDPNPDGPAEALYFSDDTSELIFLEPYVGLRRWNINTNEVIPVEAGEMLALLGFVNSTAIRKSEQQIVLSISGYYAASTCDFYLFDIPSEKWINLFPAWDNRCMENFIADSMSFSPNGRWLASVNVYGKFRIWDFPQIPSVTATAEPNSSPTPLPPTVFTCPLAPNSRVDVGDTARIAFTTGQTTRLRSAPEAGDNVITMLAEGTEFKIIGGPVCYPRPGRNDAYVYWKVSITSNSQEGWLAEGDSDSYYIEPY